MRLTIVFPVVLVMLVLAAVARAAPTEDERAKAKALFATGTTHYNLAEYKDALADFKETYRLVNDPALLYNIAQCDRQLGAFEESARLYRAYRREYPDAPNRDEVDRLIAQMDDAVARERAHASVAAVAPSAHPNEPAMGSATTLTAAPSDRPHRSKKWIWGVVAGAVVVVAAGVTVGVVLGTQKKDSTPQLPDVKF